MTLFERIYWTLFVINSVLALIAIICNLGEIGDLDWLGGFIGLQVIFTIGYWIVKLVLWIWGIHIILFPSIC